MSGWGKWITYSFSVFFGHWNVLDMFIVGNEFGVPERLADSASTVSFNVVTTNSLAFSDSFVNSIVATSMSQWNSNSAKTLQISSVNNPISRSQNDFYFSTNPLFVTRRCWCNSYKV